MIVVATATPSTTAGRYRLLVGGLAIAGLMLLDMVGVVSTQEVAGEMVEHVPGDPPNGRTP